MKPFNEDLIRRKPHLQILLGTQFLFVAFGATVLVPLLIGIDPSVALFTAGTGTLLFHLITKSKVPVFLGSSFAFIAPISEATKLYGYAGALSGLIAVGLIYSLMSGLVKWKGKELIEKVFPSTVVGPVIVVIGMSLAPVGVKMAGENWGVASVSLLTALLVVVYARGWMKLIPIFIGIIAGYLYATATGIVDFTPIQEAKWFAFPEFSSPEFNWQAILYMLPVAIAPLIEHIGDMYAIGAVAHKNFVKDPGLHRTLLGDGIATSLAGFLGGPPNTTYSEVTGAVQLTGITNPRILQITAVVAVLFSTIGKVSGFLKTIPAPVLGGIMILLFGLIASVGIRTLVESKADLGKPRNQVIISIILSVGLGGAALEIEGFHLAGIGLASVVGVVLNLILPDHSKPVHIDEEKPEEIQED
ncbi:MAG: uracil-xanthine permease family protein [Cytophagales bacterium]|nr:uracil-xanthine permease family protein [Cytophagales bacterium]